MNGFLFLFLRIKREIVFRRGIIGGSLKFFYLIPFLIHHKNKHIKANKGYTRLKLFKRIGIKRPEKAIKCNTM
jgi:hypothetical protein